MNKPKPNLRVVGDEPPPKLIELAVKAARGSPCKKSKRGAAVLGENGGMVASYNKPVTGTCDGSKACFDSCRFRCVHAETGAIMLAIATRNTTKPAVMLHAKVSQDGVLTSSGPPSCAEDAKLILMYDFAGLWLLHETGWKWYPAAELYTATMHNLGLKED